MDPAGLKTRRSGGDANRSLTTWLNVPVVRFPCFLKMETWVVKVRVKFELLTKLASAGPPSWCEASRCSGDTGVYVRADNSSGEFVHSEQISGFKREFDPGSESTLAACLTHASRTRKWSNP